MVQSSPKPKMAMDAAVAGPLLMLSAALMFTLLTVCIKLLGPAFNVWHIGFFRFFGGAVVLLALFGRHGNPYRGHNVPLLIVRGCTGSIAFIAVVTAIRLLPVSTAMVIFYAFPAFAAIFSWLIYRERLGLREMVCIVAVLTGIAILFDFQLAGGIWGQAIALIGGAFAGLTVTLIKTLREKNGPVIIYLYFCTMGTLVTLPMFSMQVHLPSSPMEWVFILGIVFLSLAAQLLMNQGFFYCKGWEGGVFMSSEVIFTAMVGIIFLGDPTTWRFWTGGALVIASVIGLNRIKAGQDTKPAG